MKFLKLFSKYKEIVLYKKEIEECLFDFSVNYKNWTVIAFSYENEFKSKYANYIKEIWMEV